MWCILRTECAKASYTNKRKTTTGEWSGLSLDLISWHLNFAITWATLLVCRWPILFTIFCKIYSGILWAGPTSPKFLGKCIVMWRIVMLVVINGGMIMNVIWTIAITSSHVCFLNPGFTQEWEETEALSARFSLSHCLLHSCSTNRSSSTLENKGIMPPYPIHSEFTLWCEWDLTWQRSLVPVLASFPYGT